MNHRRGSCAPVAGVVLAALTLSSCATQSASELAEQRSGRVSNTTATSSAPSHAPQTSSTAANRVPRETTAAASKAPAPSAKCGYQAVDSTVAESQMPDEKDLQTSGTTPMTLNLGGEPVQINLDARRAPCAVTSTLMLATQEFYNGTQCHKLSTSNPYYLQCGDPTGTGTGDAGYSFPAESGKKGTFKAGTVAMAPSNQNRNGSQFFIIWKDSQMKGTYTVIGSVAPESMPVITRIGKQGTQPKSKKPAADTSISVVTMG